MFDVSNLPLREQFEATVVVSGVCLVAAVVLREWFADREIRIIARVLGLAGWAVVVTFAWRMTETNETLATQLMVKGKTDATQIADPVRVSAVASEYSATTEKGFKIDVSRFDDGRPRSMRHQPSQERRRDAERKEEREAFLSSLKDRDSQYLGTLAEIRRSVERHSDQHHVAKENLSNAVNQLTAEIRKTH